MVEANPEPAIPILKNLIKTTSNERLTILISREDINVNLVMPSPLTK